ncbi:MAG TPA: C25 family cysteine peptidase [Gemmataceae bacterium]|nr:C25 family cysteine peptidase [Gemmataceae bacterium]
MPRKHATLLVAFRFTGLLVALLAVLALDAPLAGTAPPPKGEPSPPAAHRDKVVFLAGDVSTEELVTFTTAVAARGHPGVVLLDSMKASQYTKAYLAAFKPENVQLVGKFPEGQGEVESRLEVKTTPAWTWTHGQPLAAWRELFPKSERVVVCRPEPRGSFLQSACLAGVLEAPLFVVHDTRGEVEEFRKQIVEWGVQRIYAVGDVGKLTRDLADVRVTRLADEKAVATAYLKWQQKRGPIRTIVVANPADCGDGLGGTAYLAPWIALQKRAALLLTNVAGDNVEEVVTDALGDERLREADNLLLVAGLKAIPTRKRQNPIPGDKDPEIEMEPFTPTVNEPCTFATGRLFHDDLAVVPLMLARERLLRSAGPRRALVASNPGGSLPLLETFSRSTIEELRNAGYQTRTLLGHDLTKESLRRRMTEADVILWEGHHNTLVKEWNMPEWDEPLPPAFVFLQSCLALQDWKAQPLLSRGAVAVLGTSTRTYSGSGGACSLAFFNAIIYDDATLGGALRQAKNFLLAYAMLKEKRLGNDAQRTGANLRAAWAFTLWGDPTLKLPRPKAPDEPREPIRREVHGRSILLSLPPEPHDKVKSARFQAQMAPNARLAGLVRKDGDADGQPLVPLVFAEVHLPKAPPGQTPVLHSRLPATHWVFNWDPRRRWGYLLAAPRSRDTEELRFQVEWQSNAEKVDGG